MTTETWHYLQNQFENATRTSKKRMNILSTDHLSKLRAQQSDPDIAALVLRYDPIHQGFLNGYSQWLMQRGIYKGASQRMDELQNELSSQSIASWDNQIKVAVGEDTADYTTLLPEGRHPFQSGGRDARILAVKGLADGLVNYPVLAVLKTEVDNFYLQLVQTRDLQQQSEERIEEFSDIAEEKRIICARMMYGNLGRLMDKFQDNTEVIDRFFDLQLIRETGSDEEDVEPIPPIIVGISLPTDQTTQGTVVLKIKGSVLATGTEQFNIIWGDGASTIETLENGVLTDYSHTYTTAGQFVIQVIPITAGVLELFDVLQFDDCKLNGTITLHESVRPSGFQFPNNLVTNLNMQQASFINLLSLVPYNNNMDATAVNEALIKLDNSGLLNGFANFGGGTNDAPTGLGIAAKNSLIAKGWTVITN